MDSFYELREPEAPPELPDHWSFSALSEWHACPKRWWLLRARYPNAPTPYPQRPSVAALEGRVVHHALEKFASTGLVAVRQGPTEYGQLRETFPVRRVMRDYLVSELAPELKHNPRVDEGRLLAQVSLDDCVNAFKGAAASCVAGLLGPPSSSRQKRDGSGAASGAEAWLETDDPPLCGRLDLLLGAAIYDFKTGEADPKHVDQLHFYSLLFWLERGARPSLLALVYAKQRDVREVDVPTQSALSALRDRYAEEISIIQGEHRRGNPPAKPDEDNCRYCPVRQLCDEYWGSTETQRLRLDARSLERAHPGEALWLDLQLEDVPGAQSVSGVVGYAQVAGVGRVRVSIASDHCTKSQRSAARVLGGSVQRSEDGISIRIGGSAEVFWA